MIPLLDFDGSAAPLDIDRDPGEGIQLDHDTIFNFPCVQLAAQRSLSQPIFFYRIQDGLRIHRFTTVDFDLPNKLGHDGQKNKKCRHTDEDSHPFAVSFSDKRHTVCADMPYPDPCFPGKLSKALVIPQQGATDHFICAMAKSPNVDPAPHG